MLDDEGDDEEELVEAVGASEEDLARPPLEGVHLCCRYILPAGFLDTQVSLAPTHVSKLVGPSVTLSDFQSLVSNGRSNQKVQKTKSIYFRILLLEGPSPPTKMYMKA